MANEKKKGDHVGKETNKPVKGKKEELADVELEKISGGRTGGVRD